VGWGVKKHGIVKGPSTACTVRKTFAGDARGKRKKGVNKKAKLIMLLNIAKKEGIKPRGTKKRDRKKAGFGSTTSGLTLEK